MKKILSLLLILALALGLCACGSDSGNTPSETESTVSVKYFHGLWKYEDSDRYIMINEDNTWDYRNADMYVLSEGNYSLKDDTLVLKAEDNSTAFKLKKDGSKWLIDDEGKTLSRYNGGDTGEEDGDIRPFLGMWKYDDCELLIGINADGTWAMYDIDADAETRGTCYTRGSDLVMENEDGYKVGSLSLGSDDQLYDSNGDALSPYSEEHTEGDPELLYFNGHSYKLIDLDMSWMDARVYCVKQGGHLVTITSPEEQDFLANNFYGQKLWIGAFESDIGWRWVTDEPWGYDNWRKGEPSGGEEWCGCFWTDMEWNDIRNEDPGERVFAFICEYDGLDDTGGEGRSEKKTSWFEDHDMYVNYRCGEPAKTVVGGASVRGQDTHSYTRIPADWYVEQTSYQSTGDGNCLITLTASALTDGGTMPAFTNKEGYTVTWSWSLCDFYSGVILTEAEDDKFYAYTYDVNGEPVHIEFCYSHDITKYKDLSYELELTLTVRMPENYDGLVLVCYDAPESEEVRQQRDLIYEGQIVLPVNELPGWREMGSGLICRINN